MYSTCCSVESAGYCDFSLLAGLDMPFRGGECLAEEEEGVKFSCELLLADLGRGIGGMLLAGVPLLRMDGFDGVRVEGKDDREVCLLRGAPVLPVVPLVEGRYERTEVMLAHLRGSQDAQYSMEG